MLAFLKTGNINGLTKLPGIFPSDADKLKYVLLNHSMAMRKNIGNGGPIFANIRYWEAEIEKRDIDSCVSGRLPSMVANAVAAANHSSPFTENELRIDNAVLALIMTKELAFLNRTILMITLIATRYNEEQEQGDRGCDDHHQSKAGGDIEQGYDDDHCDSARSGSGSGSSAIKNQLAASFLIASRRIRTKFDNLCTLTGTSSVLVNSMTTMDRPDNQVNREAQHLAESYVISDAFLYFEKFDAEHRDLVVAAFLELRDVSVNAWKIMSMYAFSNLFRLTEGTEFTMYRPDDAIFAQGRDYRLRRCGEEAAVMCFPTDSTMTAMVEEAMVDVVAANLSAAACLEDDTEYN